MYTKKIESSKGVTLVALTIYILVFTLIIGVMTTISTFFFGNISQVVNTPKYVSEFNKFVMFFATDIKNYSEANVTETTIEFENGPTYKFENNAIYRNNALIAKYIMNCSFTASEYNENTNNITKNIINVNMQIGKNEKNSVTRNIDFTLKYW